MNRGCSVGSHAPSKVHHTFARGRGRRGVKGQVGPESQSRRKLKSPSSIAGRP